MFPISQQHTRALLTQITDKSNTKEQRIQGCGELRRLVLSLEHLDELNNDRLDLLDELKAVVVARGGSADLKKAIGEAIAALGALDGEPFFRFTKWIETTVNGCHLKAEEERAILVRALSSAIQHVSLKRPLDNDDIREVLKMLHKELDKNESETVLAALFDLGLSVARSYPREFINDFEDVVDVTIGWLIDISASPSARSKCEDMLAELKSFWPQKTDFGLQLMNQFLEDTVSYVTVKELTAGGVSEVRETLQKVSLILDAFNAVLKGFTQTPPTTTALRVLPVEMRVLLDKACSVFAAQQAVLLSAQTKQSKPYIEAILDVLTTTLTVPAVTPETLTTACELVQKFLVEFTIPTSTQALCVDFFTQVALTYGVETLGRIVNAWETQEKEPRSFSTLIGPSGCVGSLVFRSPLTRAYTKLLSTLMNSHVPLPQLQAVYAIISEQLKEAMGVIQRNSMRKVVLKGGEWKRAEETVLSSLCALKPLATVKNSLIVMMGLRPSLFQLLMVECGLGEEWLVREAPLIHHALLTVAKKHAETHDYFLSTSDWLSDGRRRGLVETSTTARNAAMQLALLAALLKQDSLLRDSREEAVDWLSSLCTGIPDVNALINRDEWRAARKALTAALFVPGAAASEKFRNIFKKFAGELDSIPAVLRAVGALKADDALALWNAVSPRLYIGSAMTVSGMDALETSERRLDEAAFSSAHFRAIAAFLLNRQPLSLHNIAHNGGDDWQNMQDAVDEFFSKAATLTTGKATASLTAVEAGGTAAKWRWLLAHTANYCVENRMRTYLGKPMETFNQISAELQRLAREAMTQKSVEKAAPANSAPAIKPRDVREKRMNRDVEEEEMNLRERVLTRAEEWWRVHGLLEFFEILDKLIHNAFNGSTFPLATVSLPARQFFVTNMTACQEWLSRTYLPAMAVAAQSGHAAMGVRFGHAALFELERKTLKAEENNDKEENEGEVPATSIPVLATEVLVWQTRALVELGAGAALRGLKAWTQRVFKVNMKWMDAAADMADARLEPALAAFRTALLEGKQPDNITATIRDLMLDILTRLRLPALVDRTLCPPSLSLWLNDDFEESKSPPGFDELAFQRAKSLSTFVKLEKQTLEAQPLALPWDIGKRAERRELELLSTLRRTDVAEMRGELANDARALAQCIGGGTGGGGGARLHLRVSLVSLLAGAVALKMTKKDQPDLDVNANVLSELDPTFLAIPHDMSIFVDTGERLRTARQLSLWAERLGGAASPSMHLPLAKLARKLRNPTLAVLHMGRARSASFNSSPLASATIQLHIARQGAKMIWAEGATNEQTHHFNAVFSLLSKALDTHTQHQLPPPPPRFDPITGIPLMNGHLPHDTGIMQALGTIVQDQLFISQPPMNLPPGLGFGRASSAGTSQLSPMSPPLPPIHRAELLALEEEMSKTALNIAQWLKNNPQLVMNLPTDCTRSRLWMLVQTCVRDMEQTCGAVCERPVEGAFRALAPRLAPALAKAHKEMAEWAKEEAHKGLAPIEETTLRNALLSVRGTEDWMVDRVVDALKTAMHGEELEETVRKTLQHDHLHASSLLSPESTFMELWNVVRRRRVALTRLSLDAFFAHIDQHGHGRSANHRSSIASVSSTLRLLELLVKHHDFLADAFDIRAVATNEHLWKDILPQLFARLAHPSPRVRASLVGVLSRIAAVSPHSVVYPVVVGAKERHELDSLGEEDEDDTESERRRKERRLMAACCVELQSNLSTRHPELVKDVITFVDELRRVSLLSEERWFFVLSNLDQAMAKQLQKVQAEKEKTTALEHLDVATKTEIIADKARLLTGTIFSLLEDLFAKTCVVSGEENTLSPNERSFAESFGIQLKAAFDHARSNTTEPDKAWQPFKEILGILAARASRRGGHQVHVADISTWLSKLSRSMVPVPGQETSDWNNVVFLHKVGRTAVVLPTKTRPKKITLGGSDGKEQAFLFKGQEDLHLDERVMQFLRISNQLMASSRVGKEWPNFEARHYSVTPLGARSGLIQWVNGATPLFHIYRRWQVRQMQVKAQLEKRKGASTANLEIPRATEIYFEKLKSCLRASQLPQEILADRSRWPISVLKDALQQLMRETPRDLLSRELWMRAGSGETWWRVVERFSRSAATTSMLGAVLGLGDRHLDNVLVSLETGQVVHIDYNVCFEKGVKLRVPETVPFRLTPNLVHALGPAYTEGTFGSSCVSLLSVLRTGSSTLASLFEAFVFDPLVDWASAHQELAVTTAVSLPVALAVYGTDERAKTVLPLTRALFSVRVRELSVPWMENGKKLMEALQRVCSALEKAALGVKEHSGPWQALKEDQKAAERVEAGRNLKAAIATHHHMMKEFRALLRTLAHYDARVAAYLKGYKESLSEPLIKGHQLLDEDPLGCVEQFRIVIAELNRFYSGVLELSRLSSPEPDEGNSLNDPVAFPPLVSSAPVAPKAPQGLDQHVFNIMAPPGFEKTLSHTRSAHQQENAIARANVKRVKAKLEGRMDPNDTKRVLSPEEQVDLLIRQATSSTNLALMYEGWMAWV